MKKAILILAMLSCLYSAVKAQLVNGINFQAVARNASGTVIANRKITVRMSVREGSPTGFLEYSEIKATVTNAVGLFVLVLGDPGPPTTITTGSYTGINWSTGNKYLQIEIDPTGGIDFISLGTQKINFVPFAHYANGIAARNIAGILSLEQGGTGTNNLIDLKVNLQLDKADNTSDIDKPISNAVQSALDTKESITNKSSNITNDGNSDTRYPSVKAVKSYADGIAARIPAPQVNADWNATAGVIQILNKPSLANVATSGDYNDLTNKPSVYYLPTASATTLGGVKIGTNIFIDANGVISASGTGLGSVTSIATDNTMTGGPITTFGTLKIDTTLISTKANVTAALLQKLSLSELPLSVANGGTGATSASAGLSALLPSQTGNAGKFLQTDGTTVSWVTSAGSIAVPVSGENGGTGVSNAGKTITLGGNLVTVGSFVTTLTANGTTNLTLPGSGTLATLNGTETFTNKTLTSPVITSPSITGTLTLPSGATGVTATAGDNSTKLATTAFVANAVTNALPDATSTVKGLLQLSGDLSGTAASPSVVTVGGATAANVATATGLAIAATNVNTANTIIKRDASGNFSAGTITATVFSGSLSGNASTATTAGTVTAAAQPLITSLGTLSSLTVSGTANAGTVSATIINGTLGTAAQSNITSLGTLTSLTINGTATANTFSATTLNGTLGTAAQNNITSLGTLIGLTVSGATTLSSFTTTGFVQSNSAGILRTAALSSSNVTTALGYTPVHPNIGSFSDNSIQSVPAINTATAMTLTKTEIGGYGVSLVNGTQIKVDNAGIYNLQFSAQMSKSTAGATDVTIWFRKNGTDVPNSATDFNLSGNTALEVAAWNYFFDLAAGDYVEIIWSIPVTGITIEKKDTRTTPTRPAVPSLIVTMQRVN